MSDEAEGSGADLASLEALAASADAVPSDGGVGVVAVARPIGEEVAALVEMLAGILSPILPNVAAIYTKQTCSMIGRAIEPVCVKHGWMQGGVFGRSGEEVGALCVLVPLALATYQAALVDIERAKAKPKPAPAAEGADAGS